MSQNDGPDAFDQAAMLGMAKLSKEHLDHNFPKVGPDGISLIIPAWNEELRLPGALGQYLPLLEAFGLPFEIIVVLDGVSDHTAEVARAFSSRGVRVLEFPERLGKGGAIISGFRSSKYEIVGFLDADAPVSAVSVAYLISQLSNYDGAIASRRHELSQKEQDRTLSRTVLSRLWNLLTRILLDLDVNDTQCGAKFFRRHTVMEVLPNVTLTNWAFDACLLFHFKRRGYTLVEVPVSWSTHPATKLNVEKVVPAMFLSLVGIRLMSINFLPKTTRAWAGWFYRQLG